ncbi:MAG: GNAT family N-acetyltransferase, partial [Bacteroidales bacterium]|nr:GNAT family N-acetyltransferase [Bacteroidales bacterium]
EPPTDKDSIRRIEFYSTLGFSIADIDYLQPPYAKNNPMLEMKLLIYNRLNSQELNLKEVINTIYSRVYNFNH